MVEVSSRAAALTAVAPGLLRLALKLPFPPGEVNAWLLAQDDGWTLIDCGVDDAATREVFTAALADPRLGGRPIRRILLTHFHPDHIGLAGWLHARTGAPLAASRGEWLQARLILADPPERALGAYLDLYAACGAPSDYLAHLQKRGLFYRKWVGPLPYACEMVRPGDAFLIGGTEWRVIIGEGHAPEMICLHSAERRILIAADQILPRITPHIGVHPSEVNDNPLRAFLTSLDRFAGISDDTLILPSHGEPFRGVAARIEALRAHHFERLRALVDLCATPRTVMAAAGHLFGELTPEKTGFALSEALAHLRYLTQSGVLDEQRHGGVWHYTQAAQAEYYAAGADSRAGFS